MIRDGRWALGVGLWAVLAGFVAAAGPVELPLPEPIGGATAGAAVGPAAGMAAGGLPAGPGSGINGMTQRLAGENGLGRAAFPVRVRSFDSMMKEMEDSGGQSIVLSAEPGKERVWVFGGQGMQAVELYRAERENKPVAEVAARLDKL